MTAIILDAPSVLPDAKKWALTLLLQRVVPVRSQLDPMGNACRIRILSAAEQAAPDTQK